MNIIKILTRVNLFYIFNKKIFIHIYVIFINFNFDQVFINIEFFMIYSLFLIHDVMYNHMIILIN